jgi:ferrochelatase
MKFTTTCFWYRTVLNLKNNFKIKTSTICCYPTDDNFILAHREEIIKKIDNLKNFKLIFSAHGLPEKNIKKGDPYQWQVEQSVNKIVKSINIKNLDWILSYQSRVGPLKWIGPSTEDIIIENSNAIGINTMCLPNFEFSIIMSSVDGPIHFKGPTRL